VTGGPAASPAPAARQGASHLYFVDVVRLLTVSLVIAVHVLALEPIAPTVAAGILLTVMHVSREVFFLLTAFVLTYGYGRKRSVHWLSFWRKRCVFVIAPYLVWTVIYFLANGSPLLPAAPALRTLGIEILTGTARYHLYFLLVSLQIYLLYPIFLAILRRTQRHHSALVVISAAYQILFYLAVQMHWSAGPLTGWLRAPDALLPSYAGFVLIGSVAAWHVDALTTWVRRHRKTGTAGMAASLVLGIGVFVAQVLIGHQDPITASTVWQPVVVLETFGVAWLFLLAGLTWQDRGTPGRRVFRAGSDAGFGVYLAHPLLLQGALGASAAVGLTSAVQQVPSGWVIALEMLVLVPGLYFLCAAFSSALRLTPISMPLTGRPGLRPVVGSAASARAAQVPSAVKTR
jgi:peptidoglycan/LPS O-acetylase OafA/YrhL